MIDSIESVTAAEVQKIAQEFFNPRNITLAMLGNLGDFKIRREELAC
jgi:predicted Zn-dependent peptidase